MTVHVIYSPQLPPHEGMRISYSWSGEVLTASMIQKDENGNDTLLGSDTFDFSNLLADDEFAGVSTTLPAPCVVDAYRTDAGDLHVTLVDWDNPTAETIREEVLSG